MEVLDWSEFEDDAAWAAWEAEDALVTAEDADVTRVTVDDAEFRTPRTYITGRIVA